MKLGEAIKQMDPGDELRHAACHDICMRKNGTLVDKNGVTYAFDKEDFETENWQIIRAEPEVLTAEEIYTKNKMHSLPIDHEEVRQIEEFGNSCDKNGQIKEWKRLKPLIEKYCPKELLDPPWEPEKDTYIQGT